MKLTNETFWAWTFTCRKLFDYWSIPLLVAGLFGFSFYSSVSFDSLCPPRNLSASSNSSNLLAWLFIVFSYNPFYFYKVGSNVPTLNSDLSYSLLLHFLVSLAQGLSILLIFSRNQIFILLVLCFSIHYFIYLCSTL